MGAGASVPRPAGRTIWQYLIGFGALAWALQGVFLLWAFIPAAGSFLASEPIVGMSGHGAILGALPLLEVAAGLVGVATALLAGGFVHLGRTAKSAASRDWSYATAACFAFICGFTGAALWYLSNPANDTNTVCEGVPNHLLTNCGPITALELWVAGSIVLVMAGLCAGQVDHAERVARQSRTRFADTWLSDFSMLNLVAVGAIPFAWAIGLSPPTPLLAADILFGAVFACLFAVPIYGFITWGVIAYRGYEGFPSEPPSSRTKAAVSAGAPSGSALSPPGKGGPVPTLSSERAAFELKRQIDAAQSISARLDRLVSEAARAESNLKPDDGGFSVSALSQRIATIESTLAEQGRRVDEVDRRDADLSDQVQRFSRGTRTRGAPAPPPSPTPSTESGFGGDQGAPASASDTDGEVDPPPSP